MFKGRREERRGALLFMFIVCRDMIAIVQSLTENSLGVVLYKETKADKFTPMWSSSQSSFLKY